MDDRVADLRAGIERRLAHLESYSLPQLAACHGPVDLHVELVDEIRQETAVLDAHLEELALLAEEAPSERVRVSILQATDFLAARLSRARVQAREEAIRSKRRIESSTATSQREALLGLSRNDTARNTGSSGTSGTSKDDELMNATASVTDGLRRTRQLLEQELERSSLSTQMLERSSQTLTLTSEQYSTFSGLLNASKNLITTMQKADTIDRLLIIAALLLFGLVCLLIVKRRIMDRGIRAATLFSRLAGAGRTENRPSLPSNISGHSLDSTVKARTTTSVQASQSVSTTASSAIASAISTASLASAAVASVLARPGSESASRSSAAVAGLSQEQLEPASEGIDLLNDNADTASAILASETTSQPLAGSGVNLGGIDIEGAGSNSEMQDSHPAEQAVCNHIADEL